MQGYDSLSYFFKLVTHGKMTNSNARETTSKSSHTLPFILIVVSVTVSIASLGFWWIRDDYAHLTRVLDPSFTPGTGFEFIRPIFDILFWAAAQPADGLPLTARLISTLIYIALVLAVFFFAQKIGFTKFSAFMASLLVATNPLSYETTVWICAMSGPLTEALGILALGLIFSKDSANRMRNWILACVLVFLGLLTKESMLIYTMLIPAAMLIRISSSQAPKRALIYISIVLLPALLYGISGINRALGSSLFKTGEMHFDISNSIALWFSYLAAASCPITQAGLVPYLVGWSLPEFVGIILGLAIIIATCYFKPKHWKFLLLWLVVAPAPYLFFRWGVISRYSITMIIPLSLIVCYPLSKLQSSSPLVYRLYSLLLAAVILFGLFSRFESPLVKAWEMEGELSRYIQQNILLEQQKEINTIGYHGFPWRMGWGDTSLQIKQIAGYVNPDQHWTVNKLSSSPTCPAPEHSLYFYYRDNQYGKCTQ